MSEKHAQEALLGQLEINKAEAQSGSIFKGGWRPAVGWVCAIALFLVDIDRVKALSDVSNLFYISGAGIVGAYMGASAIMNRNGK